MLEKHGGKIFALAVGSVAEVRLDLVNVAVKALTGGWVSMIQRR